MTFLYQSNPSEVMQRFRTSKPTVGPAIRALLKPGDVIIAHQRLAHCAGFNVCDTMRKNIYFRVTRNNFENIVGQYVQNENPWIGFYGLSDVTSDTQPRTDDVQQGEIDRDGEVEDGDDDDVRAAWSNRRLLAAHPVGLSRPVVSDELLVSFMQDGYIILPGFMKMEQIDRARARFSHVVKLGRWRRDPKRPYIGGKQGIFELTRSSRLGDDFMQLMLNSGLVDVAEGFVGIQNVVVGDGIADVFQVPRSDDEGDSELSCGLHDELNSTCWHVDVGRGRFKARGFDHLIRIGVALSDEMDVDENRGQLLVWPGTYIL